MRKCFLYFILTICFKLEFVQFMYGYITNNPHTVEISKTGLRNKTSISIFFRQLFSEDEDGDSYKKVVVLQY